MKVLISLIMIVTVFTVQNANATQIHTTPNSETITLETEVSVLATQYDKFPIVATTEKGYGQEYSIGATVHGSKTGYSKSISKVTVEGRTVSYSVDYSGTDKYYFSYGSEVYYFYF